MSGKLQSERQQQQQLTLENAIDLSSAKTTSVQKSEMLKIYKLDCSTKTQTFPDIKNNYKPILFALKPYHERLRLYELARKRIFCESLETSFHNNKIEKNSKRNTRRIRQFYKTLKENRHKFKSCIEAIGKSESTINLDIRHYIQVDIFGMKLLGFLDSGASLSCLSGSAAEKFIKENHPYRKLSNFVQAAGGQQYRILGYVDTNISYKSKSVIFGHAESYIPTIKSFMFM
ncbi:hypothetical protein CVS40_11682 [Lucilia cuprina]|nr:hypothetical protein CVS40_11682 [Lucilia cuprina]